MSIKHRLERLEKKLGKNLLTVYLEGGDTAVILKKEMLSLLCSAIEHSVGDGDDLDADIDFLLQISDSDRNDTMLRVARRIAENRVVRI